MKKAIHPWLYFMIIILSCNNINGQVYIKWQNVYGGTKGDNCTSIVETSDGGLLLGGHSYSSDGHVKGNYGVEDCWIVKVDSDGQIEWQNNYGGSERDNNFSILETIDGGYLIGCYSKSNDGKFDGDNNGEQDYWIIKIESDSGEIEWQNNYGGSSSEYLSSVVQTKDGGFLLGGFSSSSDGEIEGSKGGTDFWIVKVEPDSGKIEWKRNYGGTGEDVFRTVIQTSDGGYLLGGYSDSSDGQVDGNNGGDDLWIVKIDSDGNPLWNKNYGGSGNDDLRSIIQTNDGGYLLGGYSESSDGQVNGNNGGGDYWIVKIDSGGNLLWNRNYGGSGNDNLRAVIQTSDGGYLLGGLSDSADGNVDSNKGGSDYWIVKISVDGEYLWNKNFGGSGNDNFRSMVQASDGSYLIAGYSDSSDGDVKNNYGENDYWVVKLVPCETEISTPVDTTVCENETFSWGGETIDKTGLYLDTLQTFYGCDSVITLELQIEPIYEINLANSICEGEKIEFGGEVLSEEGMYTAQLVSMAGCDSLVQLELTVSPAKQNAIQESICDNESFSWNGESLDQAGLYIDTLQALSGCDSIITLDLTVNPTFEYVRDTIICPGQEIPENKLEYTLEGCEITTTYNVTQIFEQADAGMDKTVCNSSLEISAKEIENQNVIGEWDKVSGNADILFPNDPVTEVVGLSLGENRFKWTLSHPVCGEFDSDEVTINFIEKGKLEAKDDFFRVEGNDEIVILGNVLENDDLPSNRGDLMITTPNSNDIRLEFLRDGNFRYKFDPSIQKQITFQYQIELTNCSEEPNVATVRIYKEKKQEEPEIITPNGDGKNDKFIVTELEENPGAYPDHSFVVFNRWGEVVYEASPYNNDWEGTSNRGEKLEAGTYFYVLKLNLNNSKDIRYGEITIFTKKIEE